MDSKEIDQPILPTVVGFEIPEQSLKYACETDRKGFISKVYTILWFQLLITSIFIGICNQYKIVSDFMISNRGILISYISIACLFVLTMLLFCFGNTIKKKPYKWLYVITYTILMTYLLGIVGVVYSTKMLLLGGLITIGIFSGLTIYAWQTKIDYTIYGNYLIVSLIGLLFFGFISLFINIPFLNIIYSSIGSIIFSFYIVYDTQLIVGGKNRYIKYTTNDFVIASISLYLDIINLFLFIMDIINGRIEI